ncbi:MAG: hypothetical protein M0Z41_00605 [Peptococcaceae bacterium]|jgi:hypothetical protein|nr:hypothetical protein [Peptococcaceae bacterium]
MKGANADVGIDQAGPDSRNVWQARAVFYALFANVLSIPCSEAWGDQVLGLPMAEMLRDMGYDVTMVDLWEAVLGEAGPPGSARRSDYYSRLAECFQRDFLVPLKRDMIPLGACAYLGDDEDKEPRMTFFEGLYLRFGFDWRKALAGTNCRWPNEPEHAILILTMLAIISQRIAASMDEDTGMDTLSKYVQLLQEIFAMAQPWLAQCFANVASRAGDRFYRFFGRFMSDFLRTDQQQWELDIPA